jgi:hypothetical protein
MKARDPSPAVRDTHTRAACSACGARAELNRIPILFRVITLSVLIRVHRYPSVVKIVLTSIFHRPSPAIAGRSSLVPRFFLSAMSCFSYRPSSKRSGRPSSLDFSYEPFSFHALRSVLCTIRSFFPRSALCAMRYAAFFPRSALCAMRLCRLMFGRQLRPLNLIIRLYGDQFE